MNCNKLDATPSSCVGNNPQLKSPPPQNASHPWCHGINSQKIITHSQKRKELATPTFAPHCSAQITPWRWRPASRLSLKLTAAKSSLVKTSPWTHIHAAAKTLVATLETCKFPCVPSRRSRPLATPPKLKNLQ